MPRASDGEGFSPKQRARRALIVEAGVQTLRRDGVAGCTVRNVAAATPFTKGTMHYYFDDVREIVNAAFLQLTRDYMAAVGAIAAEAESPSAAFWRAVESYIEGFHGHPRTGLLWFEYTNWAVRHGYSHGIVSTIGAVRAVFAPRLAAIDIACAPAVPALVRYLFGAVFEFGVRTVEREVVIDDLARICGLVRPEGPVSVTHERICPVCRDDWSRSTAHRQEN